MLLFKMSIVLLQFEFQKYLLFTENAERKPRKRRQKFNVISQRSSRKVVFSIKKLLLKIPQNSQENTCVEVFFVQDSNTGVWL